MNFQVSWRTIAISSVAVNIGLISVLVIVTAKGTADYLSTLALGLAVIAFVAQIIVFIAQSASSSDQILRAEEVHGATMRILQGIETKAEGTHHTVQQLSDQMLATIIEKAVGTGQASSGDRESVAERVEALLSEALVETSAPKSGPQRFRLRPAPLPPLDAGTLSAASAGLTGLSDDELQLLRRLGKDYVTYGRAPRRAIGHGLALSPGEARPLAEQGLIQRVDRPWDSSRRVWVLTDQGLQASSVLLAEELPADAPYDAIAARRRLDDSERREHEQMAREAEELERLFPYDSSSDR